MTRVRARRDKSVKLSNHADDKAIYNVAAQRPILLPRLYYKNTSRIFDDQILIELLSFNFIV